MNQVTSNRPEILQALSFATDVRGQFSDELSRLLDPGNLNVRMTRHVAYVRKNIIGAGSGFDILDAETKKIDGISSIKGKQLSPNQAVIFDHIAVAFALGTANEGEEAKVAYNATNVPDDIRNAILVITQGSREVLEIPVADLIRGMQSNNSADYYHDLKGFHYLTDHEEIDMKLRFAPGVSITPGGAENNLQKYLEVRALGYKTIRRL